MRIPRFEANHILAGLAALAFALIWWGSPLVVALGATMVLAALFLPRHPQPADGKGAPAEGVQDGATSIVQTPANTETISPHVVATSIAAIGLALVALLSGIDHPVLAAKIALSALLVSRALFVVIPPRWGELLRIGAAHGGALAVAALMVEPIEALSCILWQMVWVTVDFSRVTFVASPQPMINSEPTGTVSATTIAEVSQPREAEAANDRGPDDGVDRAQDPSPTQPQRSPYLTRAVGAVAAALSIIFLMFVGFLQTMAPTASEQFADESSTLSDLWNQSPWIDRRRAAEVQAPPPIYGSYEWGCAQAARLEARGVHSLTAQGVTAGAEATDVDWTPAIQHFATPPLNSATSQAADHAFGHSCPNNANVRVLTADRVLPSPGYRAEEHDGLFVVGAIHALDLPDGRRLLLARAWRDDGDPAPSHLLMAWAQQNEEEPSPKVWLVSSKGVMGVAGMVFTPAQQPLGGYHLWYGAMGPDGGFSASSADIIDVSGSAPRNTGPIPIWGASTCGQVPGDLLEPAEPNCAEGPAWAFWLTDFQYAPGGADEVMLTWKVRRQFGEPGEPATYDHAFEETMRGRFVLGGGHWRFVGGEGALLADAGFVVARN